jgi:predicted amidohydrolase
MPYGRLTAAICADGDYPRLMHQAGEHRADLVLLPNDWVAIKDLTPA